MTITVQHDARGRPREPDEMTARGFRRWLNKFDTDHDGRINRSELRSAIRERGRWFATFRGWLAFHHADKNHNGFIDDYEIDYLVAFAQKDLGFKITA